MPAHTQRFRVNQIEKLLRVGDRRTTGKAEAVIKRVLSQPALFDKVMHAILADHPGLRMRASDVAEKITREHPEWLTPYKRLMIKRIASITQKEVRWHTAQMLPRLKLTKKERATVFGLLLVYLDDESRIVRTFTMQALAELAMQDQTYLDRVRDLIQELITHGTPAMRSRGKRLLVTLDKVVT